VEVAGGVEGDAPGVSEEGRHGRPAVTGVADLPADARDGRDDAVRANPADAEASVSATYTAPSAATAASAGHSRSASVAGQPSPVEPDA
jgi:hypothetical protein